MIEQASPGYVRVLTDAGVKRAQTPTYKSWAHMHQRCRNPKCRQYKWYGARGVRVCERWESFENFLADMGERPNGKTLDRIDGEGDYEPGNCRWATSSEQQRNRSNVKLNASQAAEIRARHVPRRVTYQRLADEYGVSYGTVESIVRGRIWT